MNEYNARCQRCNQAHYIDFGVFAPGDSHTSAGALTIWISATWKCPACGVWNGKELGARVIEYYEVDE